MDFIIVVGSIFDLAMIFVSILRITKITMNNILFQNLNEMWLFLIKFKNFLFH